MAVDGVGGVVAAGEDEGSRMAGSGLLLSKVNSQKSLLCRSIAPISTSSLTTMVPHIFMQWLARSEASQASKSDAIILPISN